MKKIVLFFITALFASSYSLAEPAVSGANAPATTNTFEITDAGIAAVNAPEKKPVSINETMELTPTKKHEENAELPYNIDAVYPQISGEDLSAEANKFNQLVSDMVNKSMEQFKNYVKADMPHMQTLPDSVKHNTLSIDYDVNVIKPGKQTLISLRLSIEGMQAGRAHPYHTHQILNFDLTTGKVIELKDLFKPNAKYLNAFSKYSSKMLGDKLQDKWMIKEGTAPLAKNYALWNLENDGILITFEEYQVAPYTYGKQEVTIPYSVLKKLLAPRAVVVASSKVNLTVKQVVKLD